MADTSPLADWDQTKREAGLAPALGADRLGVASDPRAVVFDALQAAWHVRAGVMGRPEDHIGFFADAVVSALDEIMQSAILQYEMTRVLPSIRIENPESVRPFMDGQIREAQREALLAAAREIDWEWETFTAADGIKSIRQHGKSPSELLIERAGDGS